MLDLASRGLQRLRLLLEPGFQLTRARTLRLQLLLGLLEGLAHAGHPLLGLRASLHGLTLSRLGAGPGLVALSLEGSHGLLGGGLGRRELTRQPLDLRPGFLGLASRGLQCLALLLQPGLQLAPARALRVQLLLGLLEALANAGHPLLGLRASLHGLTLGGLHAGVHLVGGGLGRRQLARQALDLGPRLLGRGARGLHCLGLLLQPSLQLARARTLRLQLLLGLLEALPHTGHPLLGLGPDLGDLGLELRALLGESFLGGLQLALGRGQLSGAKRVAPLLQQLPGLALGGEQRAHLFVGLLAGQLR